jgi:redox-regulated HSP33 family molecular chaperone
MIFKSKNTGQVFYMNYKDGIDVKNMSRLRVSVTLSPGSETYRRILLQTYMTLAAQIPSALMKQALSRLVVQTLPNVPESEKAKLADIAALEEETQMKATRLQSLQYDMQIQQLQQQAMQAQAGVPVTPGSIEPPKQPPPSQPPAGLVKAVGAI